MISFCIIMNKSRKILASLIIVIVILVVIVGGMNSLQPTTSNNDTLDFPDFFTSNDDYFVTRIGPVPNINRDTYRLTISGLVDNPTEFTLTELQSLNLTELPLTIECIGNSENGKLVGTALWKGFNVYALLETLGISEGATGVRYLAADGYYASHTMNQLKNNSVLGALYMNGAEIPPVQGFPLRILNPGYYGVKQPAWVTEIEVIDRPLEDYWEDRGWDTSPPMEIDSQIFFPEDPASVNVNQNLRVGGCAFGGTRVNFVEYRISGDMTWYNATIVQQIDSDNVWIFWEINLNFSTIGQNFLYIRATDIHGNQQKSIDDTVLDGYSVWPSLVINVIQSSS